MDARLKILSGLFSGQTVRLPRKLLIGRGEDCDLRVESDFVSTHHCVLLLDDYTLRIRDLGSKNGTFVNGRRVGASTIILLHDDTLSIGDVLLLIDLTQGTSQPEPTVSQAQAESTSNRLDGTVLSDGDTVRATGAEFILPPPVSKPAAPSVIPAASGHPLSQFGGFPDVPRTWGLRHAAVAPSVFRVNYEAGANVRLPNSLLSECPVESGLRDL